MSVVLLLAAGLALGLVMGLLGGGGGVLAIPLLLALGLPLDEATTTSLAVVGLGAAAGLATHARTGAVAWRLGLVFGALGAGGAVVGSLATFAVDDRVQLAGFVVLLVAAGIAMLRPGREPSRPAGSRPRWWSALRVVLLATGVGLVTGFFGVGGGFVAVPALVLALGMSMRRAGPTALVVILVNAAVAFAAHGTGHLDVEVTATVAAATAVGAVGGALLQPRVPATGLRLAFGVLLLAVAAYEAVVLAVGILRG